MQFNPHVLTPNKIPEFCIPPRHQSQKGMHNSFYQISSSDYCVSVIEAPMSQLPIPLDSMENSYCAASTNADPQSQAALSLTHLPKAQTSYGFCTLLESPNTRRKESLFHNDSSDWPMLVRRSLFNPLLSRAISSSKNFTSHQLQPVSSCYDSDTISSTESSPFSSPRLRRAFTTSVLKALSQENMTSKALSVKCKSFTIRESSISTDEESSTDNSPCVTRRTSYEWSLPPPTQSQSRLFVTFGQVPLDSTVNLDTGGILRLSSEYCTETLRLRIRLVSAEALFGPSVDSKNISCLISLSIIPGKNQKQKSTLIRGSRNPIFNEDFYFEGLEPHDLLQKSLKLKALNKSSCSWKENVLGKVKVNLVSVLQI
ncbi:hypothetical protein GDO86_006126 [Hymenochirus boettgeri]|uniref:C2 domain-containing protein n=1 Tax=Hymenochirus boettgeri TaxID=247094 RepID=A0A8T2JC92_9PIPI|nr:hypothetical protein GDO86_006126 [Hymenochirus boettgeri]